MLKQALIYGAEFLDVEGCVIDADKLMRVGILVEAQGAKAFKDSAIIERTLVKCANSIRAEEVASQWSNAHFLAGTIGFKQAKIGPDGQPEILVPALGEMRVLGQMPNTLKAVVTIIDIALP